MYQNCKYNDPWVRSSCAKVWPHKLYSENKLFVLKYSSPLPDTDQTIGCIVMKSKKGPCRPKFYNNCIIFFLPQGRDAYARAWPNKSYSEIQEFSSLRHRSNKLRV